MSNHLTSSTNWKPALAGSKLATSAIDKASVTKEVTRAIHLAAVSDLAGSEVGKARSSRIRATPISGEKVVSERSPVIAVRTPTPKAHRRRGRARQAASR